MGVAHAPASVGERIKRRRRDLGLSQLRLAVDADVSARHLSFIETGRARPSREMVLRLAEQLRVPLREQNALLLAAGFAPAFAQRDLDEPEMAAVRAAAALVLENHEPFPAIALDRRRDIVMHNRAALFLLRGVAAELLRPRPNIYRLILHPDGFAPRIVNLEAYSHHLLVRLQRDAELSGDGELRGLLAEVEKYPRGRAKWEPGSLDGPLDGPVALPLRLRSETGELAFITTIATFGTPFDVTLSELVIESLIPADEVTAQRFAALRAANEK
jgi:transcriptional regulator with XRE-family HTH domain